MKIAVTGPNGQLGSELVEQGCIPLYGRIGDSELAAEIDKHKPDAIINCAAKTNVDDCEHNILETIATNTLGVKYLSSHFGGYLVQISTDYIFDGAKGPYITSSKPNPLSIYGWSKLGGELVTRRHPGKWLIIRTTVLFSRSKNNFVSKLFIRLMLGEKITLYQSDLSGTPTYVPELAKETIRLVKANCTGIAHIVGNKLLTRLDFARLIAAVFDFDPESISTTDADPGGAPRPPEAGLICGHSGGMVVNSHDPVEGLRELARQFKELK